MLNIDDLAKIKMKRRWAEIWPFGYKPMLA
jgi:hypothetical protein